MIFELTKEGWKQLKEHLRTLTDLTKYCLLVVSKDKARSIIQNRWYWGYVLYAILYFINDYWDLQDDVDRLHDVLKLEVTKEFYMDLIYVKDGIIKTELSTSFEKMSRKQFNDYLDKVLKLMPRFITINVGSIDELVRQYCIATGKHYKGLE